MPCLWFVARHQALLDALGGGSWPGKHDLRRCWRFASLATHRTRDRNGIRHCLGFLPDARAVETDR